MSYDPPCSADRDRVTLVDLLHDRVRRSGDALCIRFLVNGEPTGPIETLTFAELGRDAGIIAAELQRQGLGGQRALLIYRQGLDVIRAFFGCLLAGVTAVPLYHRLRSERFAAVAADCAAAAILSTAELCERPPGEAPADGPLAALPRLCTDVVFRRPAQPLLPAAVDPDSLAFLQYTSGSTSTPKGVMVTHRNLIANIGASYEKLGHAHGHLLSWLPFFHDMGLIGCILQVVYGGAPVTLFSPLDFVQAPLRWLKAISIFKPQTIAAPDFAYQLAVDRTTAEQRQALDLSSVAVAINGAEPIRAATIDKFCTAFGPCGFRRNAFFPCYGLAESTLLATGPRALSELVIESFDGEALRRGQIAAVSDGKPASRLVGCGDSPSGHTLRIVDPHSQKPLPAGQLGEVWLRGPSVTAGYWNQPTLTAEVYGARLADAADQQAYLRTGDLGFLHQGSLFLAGRIKDLIILHGQNIYPHDLEGAAERAVPSIAAGGCAAFAIDTAEGEAIALLVEISKSESRSLEIVAAELRAAIWRQHEQPIHTVVFVRPSSIPRTTSGKVQRFACREALRDGLLRPLLVSVATTDSSPAPAPAVSTAVAALADVREKLRQLLVQSLARYVGLPAQAIDTARPIYAYGLDSIRLIQMTRELAASLGRQLAPTDLFTHPTIDAMAELLSRRTGEAVGAPAAAPAVHIAASAPAEPPRHAHKLAGATAGGLAGLREQELGGHELPLRACTFGAASGPAVVCVHGIKDQGASFALLAEALAPRNIRLIAPDLRGHGHSGHATEYALTGFVSDLQAAVDALCPGEMFTLIGHSMGAEVAALLAALHPERIAELILIEPPCMVSPPRRAGMRALRARLQEAARPPRHVPLPGLHAAAALIQGAAPGLSPAVAEQLARRHTQERDGHWYWRWDARLHAHYRSDDVFDEAFTFPQLVAALKVRVRLVSSESSADAVRALLGGAIPKARHHVLRAGHNLHLDAPQSLAALL